MIRLTVFVLGHVQGVGFRWHTRSRALELGLAGSATNLSDGRVCVVAEGHRKKCEDLLAWLRSTQAPGIVEAVIEQWSQPRGATGFDMR
ncbi:acylphosphatase [Corynebacterium sp. H128]|uniref:acylphosphatase n=1 Tax=unclassified Corynebacterium TaxID=2624378 RepID=UPI00309B0C17